MTQQFFLKIFIAWLLMISFACANNELAAKNQELKNVNREIKGLKSILTKTQTQKQSLDQQLKPIEISIGKIANQTIKTNANLMEEKMLLSTLNKQHEQYQEQLEQQKILLGQQVRATYMLGHHRYLKLLLNQEQPDLLSRLLEYFHYLNASRVNIIESLNLTLKDLAANEIEIQAQSQKYATFIEQEQQQNAALEQRYQQRRKIVAALTLQIDTKSKQLAELKKNQTNLQQLITRLKSHPQIIAKPKVRFSAIKGKFPWPTRGSITKDFDYVIDASGTTYSGVFIAAPIGQPVYAIDPGKVIFANWLGGVGLLVIIQHDDNFMSLYGHDHSLLVKVGEYVKAGQEIATVGRSGGHHESGLFFQIRKNSTPVNPMLWCR